MAGRDHGRGSRGRNAHRAHPRRTARRDGADGHGRGTVPAGIPARTPRTGRHRMAAGALRCRLRAFPVAQQQHPDRLGSAREERKRQRHARHGASHRPDHGRGPDGAAVPHRPRRQHPHGTPARRRVRTHRSRRQPYPHPATAARRVGPAEEITPGRQNGGRSGRYPPPPVQPGTARTANTQDNHTNNSIQQH